MDIYLSDKAFLGLITSALEVYRNECLGSLLGYHTPNRMVIEYVFPYQSAKRRPTQVKPNWKRESRVREIISNFLPLRHIGYFHSHTQRAGRKGMAELSETDKDSMNPKDTDIVVAINEGKRTVKWHASNHNLRGSVGKYHIAIAGFYKKKKKDGRIKQYEVICPYALGFGATN